MLFGDETGYLFNARVLARADPSPIMPLQPSYQIGYSILLLPVEIFCGGNPIATYRWALLLNGLLGATLFPLCFLIARRVAALCVRRATLVALCAAAYPSYAIHASLAWPELLLANLFLATVLAFHRFADQPSFLRGGVLVAVVAFAYLTHRRMLSLLPVTCAAFMLMALARQIRRAHATLLAVSLVLLFGLAEFVNGLVDARMALAAGGVLRVGRVFESALEGSILTVATSTAGQGWYLVVGTAGVVLLAVATLVRSAIQHEPDGRSDRARTSTLPVATARYILAAVTGLFLTSSIFVQSFDRADKLVYGRYNETTVALLLTIGLASLWRATSIRRRALELAMLAAFLSGTLGLLIVRHGAHAFTDRALNRFMVSALEHLIRLTGSFDIVAISVIGFSVAALLSVVANWKPAVALVSLGAGFFALGHFTYYGWVVQVNRNVNAAITMHKVVADLKLDEVAYDLRHFHNLGLLPYQFWLPATRFHVFRSPLEKPQVPYVISNSAWDTAEELGGVLIYAEPRTEQALWRVSSGSISQR